ncbi:hypothetical protein FQN54_003292 [Arachnomyces sp. PD_36]|nr:hypothetical protein FQN54_003292 [Arachnomyces sp. PD_36]
MAFSFGFSGDDIDPDIDTGDSSQPLNEGGTHGGEAGTDSPIEGEKVKAHGLDEMLSSLPSQLSFNTISPTSCLRLPRREVFDIRAQLMAEDGIGSNENTELISGLEKGDIQTRIYEGGFKTWECAIDLAKLLMSYGDGDLFPVSGIGEGEGVDIHIIELGAGTAMPSLALLNRFLLQPAPSEPPERKVHFTLADYNSPVLRLVTLPNIILLWSLISGAANLAEGDATDEGNDLEITPEVIEGFKQALSQRGISLDFISGSWGPEFVDTVFQSELRGVSDSGRPRRTLILASETIYSPSSLRVFSETLVSLLRRASGAEAASSARAFVAAKRVYFGVGGGVDEFLSTLREVEGDAVKVNGKSDVEDGGVGRVILELGLNG